MRSIMAQLVASAAVLAPQALGLSGAAWQMVMDSTAWQDPWWDESLGMLYDPSSATAMTHSTLGSAWYAVGLLARNGNNGQDAQNADRIINYIIGGQFQGTENFWYGDYNKESEEPLVGTPVYPPSEYASWDPNWRGFVGLSFVTIYEEYGYLLPNSTKSLMLESLHNCSVGDSYRAGGINGDNLYPAYSNPSIMRAIGTGWTGRHTGDANMTQAGEDYAQQIIDLFDMHKTLSEFNSPTYCGISLFGLTLWAKYMPEDSVLKQRGPDMVASVMETVSQLWHADMKNLAGPWDRTYSFDMNNVLCILALFLDPIVGRNQSSLRQNPQIMTKQTDWGWAPLIGVHSDFFRSLLPAGVEDDLKCFKGEHTWTGQAYYPPFDLEARNITTWMGQNMTIGAESYRCKSVNGPPDNQLQYHPAVAQWLYDGVTGPTVGWLSVYSTQAHVTYDVSPYQLKISYPDGAANSTFVFYVSPSLDNLNVNSWADISGTNISVSGNANLTAAIGYAGNNGGNYSAYYGINYWRFQYNMTSGFTGIPELTINFN